MLVKTFKKPINSIDDITNIPERRRFIVIYKYPDGPHNTAYETYQGNIYDLYVINTSTVVGSDYIIPRNIVVQYKNMYRGKVINPFLPDGSFNLNALCVFNSTSYISRIINGRDIIRLYKNDLLSNGNYENYIANLLKYDTMVPFPNYYNVEDQAHLAHGDHQKMDFEIYLNDVPQYTLNDFRDSKTSFVSLDIHKDNFFMNQNTMITYFYGNGNCDEYFINLLRDNFILTFLECYETVTRSIFAQAYIIIDIESGLINIDFNSLTLKYSYNISKKEIMSEYAIMVEQISEFTDRLCEVLSGEYIGSPDIELDMIPERIMFYISPTLCKIKLSENKKIIMFGPGSEYSASDVEEINLCKEFEDTIYTDAFYGDN
jgi:hypothetical protein